MTTQDQAAVAAEIERLQKELTEGKKQLNALRQQLPAEIVKDYTFKGPDGATTTLSVMFGDRTDLIIIHNMGKGCRYCTLWADGFNGLLPHFRNRAATIMVTPDLPEVQQEFARSRGWNFEIWSWQGTSFGRDMKMTDDKDSPWPGVSTFQKRPDGTMVRTGYDYFGPGDYYCSIWHILDLFPAGADGWEPQYKY